MRALSREDKIRLYRFTKTVTFVLGTGLLIYGSWLLVSQRISEPERLSSWFGIFPIYVGAMLVLVGAAMKEDWFTNARKYW
jgi:cytochrome c biogenesis protein CcdA